MNQTWKSDVEGIYKNLTPNLQDIFFIMLVGHIFLFLVFFFLTLLFRNVLDTIYVWSVHNYFLCTMINCNLLFEILKNFSIILLLVYTVLLKKYLTVLGFS